MTAKIPTNILICYPKKVGQGPIGAAAFFVVENGEDAPGYVLALCVIHAAIPVKFF